MRSDPVSVILGASRLDPEARQAAVGKVARNRARGNGGSHLMSGQTKGE